MSPLEVAFYEGIPVPVVNDVQSPPRQIRATYPAKKGDQVRIVADDSMAPEVQNGDMVFFRPDKAPKPGKLVWARIIDTGEVMLRRYRQVRDPKRPGVAFELVAVSKDYAPVDGDEGVELLGGVMELRRIYDLE